MKGQPRTQNLGQLGHLTPPPPSLALHCYVVANSRASFSPLASIYTHRVVMKFQWCQCQLCHVFNPANRLVHCHSLGQLLFAPSSFTNTSWALCLINWLQEHVAIYFVFVDGSPPPQNPRSAPRKVSHKLHRTVHDQPFFRCCVWTWLLLLRSQL